MEVKTLNSCKQGNKGAEDEECLKIGVMAKNITFTGVTNITVYNPNIDPLLLS
jgi:hypothetical protein